MDDLTRRVVGKKSTNTQNAAFVKKHVVIMVKEVRFEKALEQHLSQRGMVQISLPQSSSLSPKLWLRTLTPPEQSASSALDAEKA